MEESRGRTARLFFPLQPAVLCLMVTINSCSQPCLHSPSTPSLMNFLPLFVFICSHFSVGSSRLIHTHSLSFSLQILNLHVIMLSFSRRMLRLLPSAHALTFNFVLCLVLTLDLLSLPYLHPHSSFSLLFLFPFLYHPLLCHFSVSTLPSRPVPSRPASYPCRLPYPSIPTSFHSVSCPLSSSSVFFSSFLPLPCCYRPSFLLPIVPPFDSPSFSLSLPSAT